VQIQQYVTDRTEVDAAVVVTNVGVNPLRLRLRASSDLVGLAEEHVVVAPNAVREIGVRVTLANAHTVREFIEIDSNESQPAVQRIDVVVSRPPQLGLEVEPGLLYFGDSSACRLAVRHTGGGLCTIKSAYCREAWASVALGAEATLASGDQTDCAFAVDTRELPEGENRVTVVLDLAGLGEQEFTVPFRLVKRPNVHGTAIRLPELLPGRVRTAETVVRNDSDQTVVVSHVRAQGADWLRVADSMKLPFRLEPGKEWRIKVEVRTQDRAGQTLTGSLVLQWERDQTVQIPVRARVLRPQEYEGYAGIDFGTTNSCVCVADPHDLTGAPRLVPLDHTGEGDPVYVIPTVIYFPDPDDLSEFLVGERARVKTAEPSEAPHTVSRIKRLLGQKEPVVIHERALRPEEVAAQILRALLDKAEDETKRLIRRAVVTVPADYSTSQMRAMLEACRLAGLEHVDLQKDDLADRLEQDLLDVLDEPLAAAVDYIYSPQGEDLRDDRFVVYDFGGGTLDVSLVHVRRGAGDEPTELKVLAVEGRAVGGEDFTDRVAAALVEKLRAEHGWSELDLPYETDSDEFELLDPAKQQQVRSNRVDILQLAEQVKVRLSEEDEVRVQARVTVGYPPRREFPFVQFSRSELNDLIRDDVDRSAGLVQEALASAGVEPHEVACLVMTGGSSQIPLVGETLSPLGIRTVMAENPKECVARGAFRMGHQRAGVSTGALRPVGLHNKTACRYGLMVNRTGSGMQFVEVVPKGQDLPTPWFSYPDSANPAHRMPVAQRPEFSVPVARQVSSGGGSLQPVGRIGAIVPGASSATPVGVRVEMQVDRFKVLRVRVLAGGQQLEHTFSDV
jgi:molecular chaperone DnaK (HSP70)